MIDKIVYIPLKHLSFTNNGDSLGTFLCLADRSDSQVQTEYAVNDKLLQ